MTTTAFPYGLKAYKPTYGECSYSLEVVGSDLSTAIKSDLEIIVGLLRKEGKFFGVGHTYERVTLEQCDPQTTCGGRIFRRMRIDATMHASIAPGDKPSARVVSLTWPIERGSADMSAPTEILWQRA